MGSHISEDKGVLRGGKVSVVRHVVAAAAVLAACALLIGTQYRSSWKVCETTGQKGKEAQEETVVRKCSPASPTIALAPLLVALLLIWPDLSEVELFGIGRIRRRLDQQAETQHELLEGQQAILQRVETVQLSTQVASMNQDVTVQLGDQLSLANQLVALGDRVAQIEEAMKNTQVAEIEPANGAPVEVPLVVDPISRIEPWLALAALLHSPGVLEAVRDATSKGRPAAEAEGLTDRERATLQNAPGERSFNLDAFLAWRSEYAAQLELLRKARHPSQRLNDEERNEAERLAARLLAELERRGVTDRS
jgi:hypothetical protein